LKEEREREQVGKNLWDLRVERESCRFTMNTALKAAEQCLLCIEHLHRVRTPRGREEADRLPAS